MRVVYRHLVHRHYAVDNNNPNSGSGDDFNDNERFRQHSRNNVQQQQQQSSTQKAPPGAAPAKSSSDLFSKWSAVMKTKSAEVKGKLLDYIVNQNGPTGQTSAGHNPDATSAVTGKHAATDHDPYRNMASVFSIDEDQDDSVISDLTGSQLSTPATTAISYRSNLTAPSTPASSSGADVRETVQLEHILRSSDVIKAFKCQEVHMNGYMYESHLIVTGTNLLVVRDMGRAGEVQVIVRRPLSSIVKITAKKRQRDLITFKYGVTNGDTLVVTDMDRFLIPNAAAATALVSQEIIRQLETVDTYSNGTPDGSEHVNGDLPTSTHE